jgi:hypothetical protein
MHFDMEIFRKVCAFWHCDERLRAPEYSVGVPGFGRNLLPVQAHAVWHALKMFHGPEGSLFLAHVMGIGKTTIAFAIHWVQDCCNYMHRDIQEHPERHLAPDNTDESAVCPSNEMMLKKYGFDCPCAVGSTTHFIKPYYGVSVALAPLGLLDTWTEQHNACFPEKVDRHGVARRAVTLWRAHGDKEMPVGVKDALLGNVERWSEFEEDGVTPLPSNVEPMIENGRVFVVSTSQSFKSKFLTKFEDTNKYSYRPEGEWKKNSKGEPYQTKKNIVTNHSRPFQKSIVSIMFKDEFHMEKNAGSPAVTTIQETQRRQMNYPLRLAPMSGTPLTTGPGDVAHWLQLMQRDEWADDAELSLFTVVLLAKRSKQWVDHCTKKPNQEIADEIIEEFQPIIERLFLRFTLESDFLGYPPVKAPPNYFKEYVCKHTPEWESRLNQLAQEEEDRLDEQDRTRKAAYYKRHGHTRSWEPMKRNNQNNYYRARVCSIFPALMDLRDENDNPLGFTIEEWLEHTRSKGTKHGDVERWVPGTDSDPYFANLEKICESSGKLKEIKRKMDDFDKRADFNGNKPSHIWCSYFFVVVYIQYLVRFYAIGPLLSVSS